MVNSRAKGARGERLLRDELKKYGYTNARRGQQYSGASGDADVVGLGGVHIECKFVERLNLREAMEQAKSDASGKQELVPTVMHKVSGKPWLVTMELDDWMVLYQCAECYWDGEVWMVYGKSSDSV